LFIAKSSNAEVSEIDNVHRRVIHVVVHLTDKVSFTVMTDNLLYHHFKTLYRLISTACESWL